MTLPLRTSVWSVPLLVAGILGTGMILSVERYVIYAPIRTIEATPESEGLAYEDVWFTASDGVKLHGWLVPAPGARITLLWFHGNAGNISHRVNNIKYLHRLLGINVFIFDYRGYGRSEGGMFNLSEQATYRDAEGAVAHLQSRRDLADTKLVYFGQLPGGRRRCGYRPAPAASGPDPGDGLHLHPGHGADRRALLAIPRPATDQV